MHSVRLVKCGSVQTQPGIFPHANLVANQERRACGSAGLRALGADFREMTPTAEMNWCCGGGAGAFLINRAAPLRQKAWEIKRSQVEATGAETVVVSCASCRLNFMEGAEVGKSQMHIESLVELVAAQLPRPREVTSQAAAARDV